MSAKDTSLDIFGGCEIAPLNNAVDLTDSHKFIKLDLHQGQKMQLNALISQMPALAGMDISSNTMVLTFPDGINGELMKLKDMEAYTTTIVDPETGKIKGVARLEPGSPLSPETIALGVFSAMSIASGQYFLSKINNSLTQISLGLDKIMAFLYGDKRAELLAEVNFIHFAYENYISVMEHSEQRIATLTGLQNAKKVAMKDIEFYLSDLDPIIKDRKNNDVSRSVAKMAKTKECLDLSLQLYTMSNLLEVYYAQNYDSNYISFVKNEASKYISLCEKKLLSYFGQLQQMLNNAKDGLFSKLDKESLIKQVDGIMEELVTPDSSPLQRTLQSALDQLDEKRQYYISDSGVYLKAS